MQLRWLSLWPLHASLSCFAFVKLVLEIAETGLLVRIVLKRVLLQLLLLLRRPLPIFIFLRALLPVRVDLLRQLLSLGNFTFVDYYVWRILLLADGAMVLDSSAGGFVVVTLRPWFGDK